MPHHINRKPTSELARIQSHQLYKQSELAHGTDSKVVSVGKLFS